MLDFAQQPARFLTRGVTPEIEAAFLRRNRAAADAAGLRTVLTGPLDDDELVRTLEMAADACIELPAEGDVPNEDMLSTLAPCSLYVSLTTASCYRLACAHAITAALAARAGLESQAVETTETVLQEAILNAVVHGNFEIRGIDRNSASGWVQLEQAIAERMASERYGLRRVRILASWSACQISLRVCDEGEGFRAVSTGLPAGAAGSGRGLVIMRQLTASLTHSAGGRCVEMTVRR
jgi:anti-sigma regulatory factor (Ser/Thr protein kinase)